MEAADRDRWNIREGVFISRLNKLENSLSEALVAAASTGVSRQAPGSSSVGTPLSASANANATTTTASRGGVALLKAKYDEGLAEKRAVLAENDALLQQLHEMQRATKISAQMFENEKDMLVSRCVHQWVIRVGKEDGGEGGVGRNCIEADR